MFGFNNKDKEIIEDTKSKIITEKETVVKEELHKEPVILQGFKAFNSDMKCKDFQYEENKLFIYNNTISICEKGFHFCESLLDCYSYYEMDSNTVVCKVESQGEVKKQEVSPYYNSMYNPKIVTNKLFIKARLSNTELLEYILSNKYGLTNPINKELLILVRNYLKDNFWDKSIIEKAIKDTSLILFCNDTIKLFTNNGFTKEESFELLKIRYNKENI